MSDRKINSESIKLLYEAVQESNYMNGGFSKTEVVHQIDNQLGEVFKHLTDMVEGFEESRPTLLLAGTLALLTSTLDVLHMLEALGLDVVSAVETLDASEYTSATLFQKGDVCAQ